MTDALGIPGAAGIADALGVPDARGMTAETQKRSSGIIVLNSRAGLGFSGPSSVGRGVKGARRQYRLGRRPGSEPGRAPAAAPGSGSVRDGGAGGARPEHSVRARCRTGRGYGGEWDSESHAED